MALNEQTELLREMRDFLRVMAEPALAKRDAKLRLALLQIAGKSNARVKAILLMDGSKKQAAIGKESGMDSGNMSRLIKALRVALLIAPDEKHPQLVISVPPDFFEESEK